MYLCRSPRCLTPDCLRQFARGRRGCGLCSRRLHSPHPLPTWVSSLRLHSSHPLPTWVSSLRLHSSHILPTWVSRCRRREVLNSYSRQPPLRKRIEIHSSLVN